MLSKSKKHGKIFVISGSSGSGKTTLLTLALKKKECKGKVLKVTTVTTRKRRAQEINGKDYQFVGRDEFLSRKRRGEFIESQRIYGDYYGSPTEGLRKILEEGHDALLCIDVKGALTLKRIFPKRAVLIFIMVPNIEKLRERLSLRLSESNESLQKRLQIANKELRAARHYDYVIVNDILKEAVKKLSAVLVAEKVRPGA